MTESRTVGEILRAGRLARGKTAREIGAKLDRSKATIKSWERDESDPDPDDLERLIGYYHLDPVEVAAANAAAASADVPVDLAVDSRVAPAEPSDAGEPETLDTRDEPPAPEVHEPQTGDIVVVSDVAEPVPAEVEEVVEPLPPDAGGAEGVDTDATPVTPIAAATPEPQGVATAPAEPRRRRGFFSALRDPERPWLGYIRAFLTIAVLVGLGWVFMWAIRELFAAVGELRGSDSTQVEALLGMILMRSPG